MFFRPIRLRSGQALALRMSPGPLLVKDMNPNELDYDNYWDEDIKAHLSEFVLLSKAEYEELLKRTGLFIQESQRSIFDELNRRKKPHKNKK